MILAQDNYLPQRVFEGLQKECLEADFKEVEAGDKSFLCIDTPRWLYEYLKVDEHRIVFTFIRKAHSEFDTSPRIHADGIIAGERIALASVLYINQEKGVTTNGTAFWEHHEHGHEVSESISEMEFDRLLLEESNQNENFTMTDKILARPNRLLLYKASFFHSKWPFKISKGERIVCVSFYSKID